MGKRLFRLKATSSQNASNAIILSFHGKWLDAIKRRGISVVFRKMGPTTFVPNMMYAYLAQPVSAIVTRTPITDYGFAPLRKALALATQAELTQEEIRLYAEHRAELLVYHLGEIQLAPQHISFDTLANEYDFWPSSNYIPLSTTGKDTLDALGLFGS